jgi:hypothetical protein
MIGSAASAATSVSGGPAERGIGGPLRSLSW